METEGKSRAREEKERALRHMSTIITHCLKIALKMAVLRMGTGEGKVKASEMCERCIRARVP